MELRIYSIFDSKVEAFRLPFFQRAKGEALRTFARMANDPESPVCVHPEDHTLFEIGTWDDKNSRLEAHSTPISLGLAVEHKKVPAEQATLPGIDRARNPFNSNERTA